MIGRNEFKWSSFVILLLWTVNMAAASMPVESKHIYTVTPEQRAALLSPGQNIDIDIKTKETLQAIRNTYDEQGFVLVRGLLDDDIKDRLRTAGDEMKSGPIIGNQFTSLEFGSAFNTEKVVFREAALDSAIPAMIARVLLGDEQQGEGTCDDEQQDSESSSTLRLLKDCFMAKGTESNHCGWHVDDNVFWPTDSSSSGVNVWLSLDHIPAQYGGGMAVAPKSHTADWRQKAYETIGSTPILPPEGISPSQLLKTFGQTCEMEKLNEEVNAKIESTKLEIDYEPGDCLFCHRWLFHRSVPINSNGIRYYSNDAALKRYTIRYERGSAKLIRGVCLEPSVLLNPENSGKSLDAVCSELDKPFYPQCWPPLQAEEGKQQVSGIEMLSREILPVAAKKKIELIQGLMADAKKD